MKRIELLSRERIRHEGALSDINAFCDFLKSSNVRTGKLFVLPDSGKDMVYCLYIDYEYLSVRYSYKNKEICTGLDLCYVPQKTFKQSM